MSDKSIGEDKMKIKIDINRNTHMQVLHILECQGYKGFYSYEGDCTLLTKDIDLADETEHSHFCRVLHDLKICEIPFEVKP